MAGQAGMVDGRMAAHREPLLADEATDRRLRNRVRAASQPPPPPLSAQFAVGQRVEAAQTEWDAIVLPGGMPGAEHLRDSPVLTQMLKQQAEHAERIRRNEERIAELGRANAQLRAEVLRMNARAGLAANRPPARGQVSYVEVRT